MNQAGKHGNAAVSSSAASGGAPERQVLVLLPGANALALRQIVDALPDWNIFPMSDLNAAKNVLHDRTFRVGLAVIDTPVSRNLKDMEEVILESPGTEWIALVSRTCLEIPGLTRLLADVFYDHHSLPVDRERLLACIGHAYGKAALRERLAAEPGNLGRFNMVGSSSVMQQMYSDLLKMSPVDAPILITGENGTGKKLAARAIHQLSPRCDEPFVAVNCGALPAQLIQSELFGHEKDAYAGMRQRKTGHIEAAQDGSIFLDEIGDLSPELQVNLLRFLQEKSNERAGSARQISAPVRVIAATRSDLESAVKNGRFREDLYYRLNVLHLKIPALRHREEDIELLARTYFERFVREKKSGVKGFTQEAVQVMRQHDWPGNVRELINRVQRAVIMSNNRLLTAADLGLERRDQARLLMTLEEARAKAERDLIQLALRAHGHNVSEAARHLGISRATFYRLLGKEHNLKEVFVENP